MKSLVVVMINKQNLSTLFKEQTFNQSIIYQLHPITSTASNHKIVQQQS